MHWSSRFAAWSCLAIALSYHAQSTDVPTWYDSQLPPSHFVAVDAEYSSQGQWRSRGAGFQPFRTALDPAGKRAYWRKDNQDLAKSWYGEIHTFDDKYVYLHSETFPILGWESTSAWDERIDRFRLFTNAQNPAVGRVLAPRTVTPGWSYHQTVNTYVCGISQVTPGYAKVDGFLQANATFGPARGSATCPLFQSGVQDTQVTATIVDKFDILEAGPAAIDAPTVLPPGFADVGPLPRVFDKALVISQLMSAGSVYARERFIFGWHAGKYYGIIAWDSAVGPFPDKLTPVERTIGLREMKRAGGETMDFDGMVERSRRDRTLAPPGVPTALTAECVPNSNMLALRWKGVDGETGTDVRVDDLSDPWRPGVGNDLAVDAHPGNAFIFPTTAGHRYQWWVHARNEAGVTDAASASLPAQACSGSTPTLPGMPQHAAVHMAGDIATLSWGTVPGATRYDVIVWDAAFPPNSRWEGVSVLAAPGLVAVAQAKGESFIVQAAPGRQYAWSVRAGNAAGVSNTTTGPLFKYAPP